MRKLLFANLLLLIYYSSFSQVDCEDYFAKSDSLNDNVFTGYYEEPPSIINKEYFSPLSNTNDKEKGKVFVRFIVDTLGKVHCAKIIKSNNEQLNTKAIEILDGLEFSPAMSYGTKIIAPMVLPITFGEQPKKEKGKK